MAKYKRINSVSHSIAHHAVSALSFLHPYLGEACEKANIKSVQINLLSSHLYPDNLKEIKELETSLQTLKKTFIGILQAEGFSLSDLSEVTLTFSFEPKRTDNFCSMCNSKIITNDGKTREYTVDFMGRVVNT